jgi:histidine ammonia-lyase
MGSIGGRKALRVCTNLRSILAIELLCAAQAFDFRRPLKSGKFLDACHDYVRQYIDHADEDRRFGDDIETCIRIVKNKELVKVLNNVSSELNIKLSSHDEVFGIY